MSTNEHVENLLAMLARFVSHQEAVAEKRMSAQAREFLVKSLSDDITALKWAISKAAPEAVEEMNAVIEKERASWEALREEEKK
jgi:hypothetical protein